MGNEQMSKLKRGFNHNVSGNNIKRLVNGYGYNNINDIIKGYINIIIKTCIVNDIIDVIRLFIGDMNVTLNVYQSYRYGKQKIKINVIDECNQIFIDYKSLYAIKNNKLYKNGACLDFFNDKTVICVQESLVSHHTLIQTNKGLYGFGYNERNQLGIDAILVGRINALNPILVSCEFNSILCQIKCGLHHSLFLCENGNVYGCGDNDRGQLSNKYDSKNKYNIIQCIIDSNNISYIDCSAVSSYILDINGNLKAFGNDVEAQLGMKNKGIEQSGRILFIANKVSMMSCGYGFFVYLTKNEVSLYCDNGLNMDECHFGNKLKLKRNIISIKCGGFHTILKTNINEYYSFGDNSEYQLLIKSDKKKISKPTLISNKYLYKMTKSNKMIIDLLPSYLSTYIIQES